MADFRALYFHQEHFIDRLVELLPQAGVDRICVYSASVHLERVPNKTILSAARV